MLRREDLARFEAAFAAVFGEPVYARDPLADLGHDRAVGAAACAVPSADPPSPAAAEDDSAPVPAAWSDVELLREKDFAAYTEPRWRWPAS